MTPVPVTRRLLLASLAGLGIVFVLWRWAAGDTAVPRLAPAWVPFYLGVVLLIVGLNAARWRMILARLGVAAPLRRLVPMWLGGRAVGSLVPSATLAGEPVRASLLAADGASGATSAGAVALDRALETAGNVIAGPACVVLAIALGARSNGATALAVGGASVGLALLAFVYARGRRGAPAVAALLPPRMIAPWAWVTRWRAAAVQVDVALHDVLARHPGLVPAGLAIALAVECLRLVEMAALFAVFGLAVPLPLLLLSSIGIGVARAAPVSAALGSLEATQVGIFTLGGRTLADGLAVGVALRAAETLWIVVGLACLAALGRTRGTPAAAPRANAAPDAAGGPASARR